jgi:uncharacterized phage protein gp47/JayE
MPLFAETESKIFGDIIFDIVNETNITRASPGSKARTIASSLSRKLDRMWRQFDLNIVQSYVTGAEGRYLDLIGVLMGCPRLGETPATATASQKIVRFYVDVGTFGGINGGDSIYLPKGTVISTQAYGEGTRYRLPYAVILASDQVEMYVPAEAMATGTASNVGAKQLIYHDFTDYTESVQGALKVTNESEILVGNDIESDTNYRFRLANRILSAEAANETAIRLAALVVPGVADTVMLPYYRGIGSYDMLIKATTPRPPAGLITAVQEAITRVTAYGCVPSVRAPVDLGLSLVASVVFRKRLSPTEASNVLGTVTRNVTDYINNLDIAEDFIVNEVVERVMGTSDLIKNIGSAGQPLDSLWLHVPSKLEDSKVRSTLLGDYTPASDSKLSVEDRYAGGTPILIKAAE